jgi:1-acyl-sn-glycerol-3-phosphate acyltransferase
VVPMALSGLWGSFFSRAHGKAMSRPWKMRPFMRVGVAVGAPLAPEAALPEALQGVVRTLRGEIR